MVKNAMSDFFKNHKKLSIFLIIIGVLALIPFVFFLFKSVQVSMMSAPTERHYVNKMNGFVEPMNWIFVSAKDISTIKEMNSNTLTIYPSTFAPPLLSFIYWFEKPFLIGLIKEAKNQGLAVRVSGQSGPSCPTVTDDFLNTVISNRVLEWAEISEELGVEYFSPWTEVDCIGTQRAIEWHSMILPQIRERFSGKVFAGWTCCSHDDVYTEDLPETVGYDETGTRMEMTDAFVKRVASCGDFDGVVLDIAEPNEEWMMKYWFNMSRPQAPEDDWRPNSLEEIVIETSRAADELGIPIYVGEVAVQMIELPFGLNEGKLVFNQTEHAEYLRKYFETVMPYYDGVSHCGFLHPTFLSKVLKVNNSLAIQVITEKFGEYNQMN